MQWISARSMTTCAPCALRHGKIYEMDEAVRNLDSPPLHENCKCLLLPLPAVRAGTATSRGLQGVDYIFFHHKILPEEYITKSEAEALGWVNFLCNLFVVAPEKLIGGDRYWNKEKRLPDAFHREWYEADLEMVTQVGHARGSGRLYYSNDGLAFVSYDHGHTFYEIVE